MVLLHTAARALASMPGKRGHGGGQGSLSVREQWQGAAVLQERRAGGAAASRLRRQADPGVTRAARVGWQLVEVQADVGLAGTADIHVVGRAGKSSGMGPQAHGCRGPGSLHPGEARLQTA